MSKKKGFMGIEKGSFAEGLAKFNHRGGLIEPAVITNRGREILLEIIKESKSNTSIMFDEDEIGKRHLGYFLEAMHWLEYQLTGKKIWRTHLNKKIGWWVHSWMVDNKNHHLSGGRDCENAMQWIFNKINKRYSQNELTQWDKK